MKIFKRLLGICLALLLIAGIVALYFFFHNWTWRFHSELDQFFGEGNWECVSEETKESIIFSRYVYDSVHDWDSVSGRDTVPGEFQNWHISFEERNGEQSVCTITNHTYKINHDKYDIFSSKRYSARQALILELMDLSFDIVGDVVLDEILSPILPENAADCLGVSISYHNGNPPPKFYDELFQQKWFNIWEVSAEDYLACGLYEFYLDIVIHDYKFNKLEAEEKQAVLDAFDSIQEKLLLLYGENASFRLYFDSEHNVEYLHGVRQGIALSSTILQSPLQFGGHPSALFPETFFSPFDAKSRIMHNTNNSGTTGRVR